MAECVIAFLDRIFASSVLSSIPFATSITMAPNRSPPRGRAARICAAGRTLKVNIYPGANHAFFNDTGGAYNETAALAAWRDTLAWFATYLRGAGLPGTGDGSMAGAAPEETEEVAEE